MISIANTKKVVTKGRINVSHGQWVIMATASAITERKNKIQYSPVDRLRTSISI
jgi:hypothetical protein